MENGKWKMENVVPVPVPAFPRVWLSRINIDYAKPLIEVCPLLSPHFIQESSHPVGVRFRS
jgi:hypothetical protein